MSEILTLESWRRFEYTIQNTNHRVSMELRRMSALEAAPFKRVLATARRKFAETVGEHRGLREPAEGAPEQEQLDYLRAVDRFIMSNREAKATFYESLPNDLLHKVFQASVRSLSVSLDGKVLENADALQAIADEDMLMFVINHLEWMSSLSDSEGKASASPSTSVSGRETSDSTSTATPTGSEAGTLPSTVPATSEPESSIAPSV